MNYNKVLIAGRLTRDPETRQTQSGTTVCNISLACNRKYKDQEETVFVDVTFWGKTAEVIDQYVNKGDPLFVEGRWCVDQWTDKDGNKRSKAYVTAERFEFVGGAKSEGQGTPQERPVQQPATATVHIPF